MHETPHPQPATGCRPTRPGRRIGAAPGRVTTPLFIPMFIPMFVPMPVPMPVPTLLLQQAGVSLPGGRHFGPFDGLVRGGETVAVLGPSGAGKSTLLRLMAGELSAQTGQVLIDGRPLVDWPRAALASRRAVLPQSHGVAFGMPVQLVVALGRIAREPDPTQPQVVAEALAQAQAAHLAGRRFDTLSGGEQARVMLARVLAQLWDSPPGWLLVDEPLAALDPGLQLELTAALGNFCAERGHALVAVLHDLNLALGAFDRLWLVQAGQWVADLPADARAVPALETLFGVRLKCVHDTDGRPQVLLQRPPRGRGTKVVAGDAEVSGVSGSSGGAGASGVAGVSAAMAAPATNHALARTA